MQRKMKFALFGNTYQEHKSAHVTHLLEILRRKEAHICIHREFYEFLRLHTNADLTNLEIFNGHDFTADMALSVGGDGTFLKTASLVGNKEIPILGINTGRLGFLADIFTPTNTNLSQHFPHILRQWCFKMHCLTGDRMNE